MLRGERANAVLVARISGGVRSILNRREGSRNVPSFAIHPLAKESEKREKKKTKKFEPPDYEPAGLGGRSSLREPAKRSRDRTRTGTGKRSACEMLLHTKKKTRSVRICRAH